MQNSTHTIDEVARLGRELFYQRVAPQLPPALDGHFVAIDVATGDFELDADDFAAVERLRKRHPSSEIWLERVGQPTAYRMGAMH